MDDLAANRAGYDARAVRHGDGGGMTTVESDEGVSTDGLGHVLRRLRDPVLLLLVPLGFAALDLAYGHGSVDAGFDFRGTLWEPARALLDGVPLYPEPTELRSRSATRPCTHHSRSS